MEKTAHIAIDMGAGSIRIILGTLSNKIELEEVHRFDNIPLERNGHIYWNLPFIEDQIKIGVKKAINSSAIKVSSISTDSWGVDFVCLDKEGKPMGLPVAYRDSRTIGMTENWESMMSKEETFKRTGINFYPFNSLFQFLSIKNDQSFLAASKILFIASYINFFLGGKPKNELSLSSTSQMLNVEKKDWDKKILRFLNISAEKFEKPIHAGTLIGNLKEEFFSPSTQIALSPGHDSACALIAIPATNPNFAFLSTGTWCVLGAESDAPFTSKSALDIGITNEMTPDGRFRPLKNIMGLWLVQQLRQHINPNLSYTEIEKICEDHNSTGLLIDAEDLSFYSPKNMVKAFDNYIHKKYGTKFTKPSDYFICAYESLAKSFSKNLIALEELRGDKFDCLHITGGGCQSAILCQLTANTTGLTVYAGPVEGAAMGNILYQGIAFGQVFDLKQARKIARESIELKTYYPNFNNIVRDTH